MKILKFIKKIPAGTILIPMFISAFFYTIAPDLFKIGGLTQAILTDQSLNFLIGVACFCSGLMLDLKTIQYIIKKQGSVLLIKAVLGFLFSYIFYKLIGTNSLFDISTLSIILTLFSCNPALYLSIIKEHGTQDDLAAFSLIGIVSLPILPMIFFSLINKGSSIDFMALISTVIPIILGMILGNLDPNIRKALSPLLPCIMPFMGWAIGTSLNLFDAFKSGVSGVILVFIFYLLLFPLLYLFETKILKTDGISSIATMCVPGVTISYPAIIGKIFTNYSNAVSSSASQIAFATIITSVLTPILANRINNKKI